MFMSPKMFDVDFTDFVGVFFFFMWVNHVK